MKLKIIIIILLVLSCLCYSQEKPIKTHLFLGDWESTEGNKIIEKWRVVDDSEYTADVYEILDKDTVLKEKIKLKYINNVLYYCPLVFEQNNSREIEFKLVSLENDGRKFIFENSEHDFPQRIIYNFKTNMKLHASIEGYIESEFKQINFSYKKTNLTANDFILTGIIRKEAFFNKAGREIEGVFDYYFEIDGVKYFIKFHGYGVTVTDIEKYIDMPVRLKFKMLYGLWDADDNTYQSRVGNYVGIISVEE